MSCSTRVALALFGSRWEQLPEQFLGEVCVLRRGPGGRRVRGTLHGGLPAVYRPSLAAPRPAGPAAQGELHCGGPYLSTRLLRRPITAIAVTRLDLAVRLAPAVSLQRAALFIDLFEPTPGIAPRIERRSLGSNGLSLARRTLFRSHAQRFSNRGASDCRRAGGAESNLVRRRARPGHTRNQRWCRARRQYGGKTVVS